MNTPLALETEHLSIGALLGEHGGGGCLTRDFEGKAKFCFYQGMCKPGGWGVCLPGILRNIWRRALETEHLYLWELC